MAPLALRYCVKRQLETFRRHRIAILLPILIAVLVSSYFALSKAPKYESSVNVWFDTATPSPSSLVVPPGGGAATPAAEGQQTLQEFLGTQQFLTRVGHRGPLAAALGRTASGPALDGEIVGTLQKAFTVSVSGPQVVSITMTGKDPSYMPGTLTAVASEYQNEVNGTLQARQQASDAYYQSHPGSAAPTTPDYSLSSSFHVIDSPSVPWRLSNKKHMIFTVVAGLAIGLAISVLALSALTGLDKSARRRTDVEEQLGMEVVGTIHAMPRHSRIPGVRHSDLP